MTNSSHQLTTAGGGRDRARIGCGEREAARAKRVLTMAGVGWVEVGRCLPLWIPCAAAVAGKGKEG